jgi:membrane protein
MYGAIDDAVRRIMNHGTLGLIAFAGVLAIWDVSSVVRACMGGMNAIYEQKEERSLRRRFGISLGLGIAITLCIFGAVLAVTAGRRLAHGNSVLEGFLLVAWWVIAVAALALAVGLLVQFAPTNRRGEGWVGLGTLLVVGFWIAASLLFGWFVSSVANFKTAAGQLTVFLFLTTYVYTSSIIFLVGVELDELLRKDATRGQRGLITRLRGVTGG